MKSPKVATSIVDKNGKRTTVYKNAEVTKPSRVLDAKFFRELSDSREITKTSRKAHGFSRGMDSEQIALK